MEDTQINVGMNVDGVVSGVEKGKRKISELGDSARAAGKGTGAIGDGMAGAAQKVESATKNMIGSIQRQTAAIEAGDKASRKYQESLAKMRGIDVATLKPYLDQLDAAKAKQDATATSMATLRSAGAAAGLALAAAAAGLSAFTKSSIDSADAMNDMSQRVGIAVGDLAKYQLAAEQSGTSMEAVAKGIKGMAGNMLEHGAALKKAGIDAATADVAMQQLADVFASMPDGMEKTTLAVKLFGKSGMDLIPMLNLGSKGLAEAAEKSAEFAVQMAALAPLADAFNDNMAELALSSKTIGLTMANQLMPVLMAVSGEMLDSKNGANSLAESFGKGLSAAIETSIVLLSDLTFVFKGVGREMGALAAQYVAFMSLDFRGFTAIGDAVKFDAENARKELDAFQARVLAARNIAAQPIAGTYAQRSGVGYKAPADAAALLAAVGATEKVGKAAKSATDEWAKLNDEISKAGELAAAELSSASGLSAADKYRISTLDKLIDAYQSAKISLAQYIDLEAKMTDVEGIKRAEEEAKAALKIAEDRASLRKKEYEDAAAFELVQTEANNASVKSAQDALKAAQDEYAQYGLTKSQIAEITLLKLQDTLASTTNGTANYNAIQLQIDAQRELIGVLRQSEVRDAAVKAADEWKRTSESISDSLTDAFLNAANNGENAFESLKKSVEKMFNEMVLKPIVQAGVSTVMDAVGLGSTTSTTGGIMGMANTASSLNSIWGAGSQLLTGASVGASSASLIGANAVGALGGDALGTLAALNGGWSGVAAGTTAAVEAGTAAAGAEAVAAGLSATGIGAIAAIAVLAIAAMGNNSTPSYNTGDSNLTFNPDGTLKTTSTEHGYSTSSLAYAAGLQDSYTKAAEALGITMAETNFATGSNSGKEASDPQVVFASSVNGQSYQSAETQASDAAAVELAASRAVFNALQASELPKYLAGAFDSITASTATQEQITAALEGAEALKGFHDQLQLLPWDSLKDLTYAATQALADMSGGLDALQTNLGTFYENFYSDAEKVSLLTANTSGAFAALGITMPAVDSGLRDWYRTLVDSILALDQSDAANAGATVAVLALQDAVDALAPAFEAAAAASQEWQDKLDVLTGKTTERAQQLQADLASAADDATRALIEQVYALEDMATAQQAAMDAVSESVQTAKDAAQAAYEDLSADIQAALDPVAESISKLQTLSNALQTTLDSMALAGSEGSNRLAAQGQISSALDTARTTGALPLDGQLDAALRTVAQPSEKLFATFEEYARDFYKTANDIAALGELTAGQLTADEVTQDLLKQQLSQAETEFEDQIKYLDAQEVSAQALLDAANATLDATTTGALSVVEAITALQEAMKPGSTGGKAGSTGGANGIMGDAGDVWGTGYINNNKSPDDTSSYYGGFFDGYLNNVDAAEAVVQGLDWSDPAAAINQLWQAQQSAGDSLNNAILSAASGFTPEEIAAMFETQGLQSFAVGTNRIPRDMIAQLHEGEAIVPAAYNPANGGSMVDNAEVLAKFDAMIARLERIEASNNAISESSARTDKTLVRVTRGGDQMQVGSDTATGSVLAL